MAMLVLLPRAITSSSSRAFNGCRGRLTRRQGFSTQSFSNALSAFVAPGLDLIRTPHPRSRPARNEIIMSGRSSAQRVDVSCFSTASDAPLEKLTVAELKERLREEGLPTSGLKAELVSRLSGTTSATSTGDSADVPSQKKSSTKKKAPKRKFTINPNWQKEFNAKAMTDQFDKMAKSEGFDDTTAYYADDATFEDDFTDDDYILDVDEDGDDDGDVDDDPVDFDAPPAQSMEERLAAARRDSALGRTSVPEQLDRFSQEVSFDDLKSLGFRREVNPFGNDETPRREQFKVITGAMSCSGCGESFQDSDELRPGYLPPDKFEIQTKLAKIEEAQSLQEKAESDDWSADDEIEWLIRESGGGGDTGENEEDDLVHLNLDQMAEKLGLDLEALSKKKVLCKRCHGLQNFGTVEEKLRPGWTEEPTLSQEEFRKLLLPLREKKAVILALVDLFDFSGSVLPELDQIAGDNPVILAANKADLLPSQMGQNRAENWVRRELEHLDVQSIANVGGAVRLVSCKTGFGITAMMEKAKSLAAEMDCDIYIVGAANAGKSTLVNYLLDEERLTKVKGKKRAGNANKWKGSITTSPLPGTTLKFIKIDLGGGLALYDTPGLLIPGCLTERLTPAELKVVVPKK